MEFSLSLTCLLAYCLLYALFRRIHGGWLGLGKVLPVFLEVTFAGLPWLLIDIYAALGMSAFAYLFWQGAPFWPHHVFTGEPGSGWEKQCIKRYWHVACAWILADRYWPRHWIVKSFIDGQTSVGELGAGFLAAATNLALVYAAYQIMGYSQWLENWIS